jgi:hypothetical protein
MSEIEVHDRRLQGFGTRAVELLEALRSQACTASMGADDAEPITIDLPLGDEVETMLMGRV